VPEPESTALPAALTEHVGYLAVLLGQRAQADFEAAIEPLGLVPGHYDYLATLREHGPTSQRHLATVLGLDPARVVALTDQLAERGLVTREVDPSDRRRNRITLTRAGTTLVKQVARIAAQVEAGLMAGLSRADQAELRRLLRAVTKP